MRTLLRYQLPTPAWTTVGLVLLCLLIGAGIPVLVEIVGDQPGRLAALPALLLLGVLLIYDYKKLLILILLLRSVGDMALESTQLGFGNFRMGVGGLINLVVIVIAIMLVLEKPKLFPSRLASYWMPVLMFMAGAALLSYDPARAIKLYLGMLSYFAIFVIAVYLVRSNEDFNKAIRLVLWSSLIPTLYSFVEIALHMRDSSFRLRSTFTHSNIQAFYLMLILVLCLYMLKSPLFKITPRGRFVICCYMPLQLGQLLLTQTRSAWLACALVFGLYALLYERKYLLYLLLLPLAVVFVPAVSERLMDLGQGNEAVGYARLNSFAWRLSLWESAIGWMEPLRLMYGYGLGGFEHFAQTFFEKAGDIKWDAHNVYVQFLFDMGVLGLLCYLWLYARVLWTLRTFARIERVSSFLLVAIVLQYLIVSFSDNLFGYLVFNWYFWFTAGGACSLIDLHSQSRPRQTPAGPGPATLSRHP
jgi:O-antigen ligase